MQRETCPHCGIVFEKYLKYHPVQTDQQDVQAHRTLYEEDEAQPLTQFLFHEAQPCWLIFQAGRLFLRASLFGAGS